jgi:signal transduction histidine kinase
MPLLTVGLATLAHWLLQEYTQQTVLIFYFGAVIFTSWYGGLIPGLLTTVLSVLAADYFVLEPVYRFGISNVTELIALALFGSFAAMASGLSGQLRAARAAADLRALQAATLARQLEEQAGELEQQNIELEQQAAELEQQYEEAQGLSARLEQAFAAEQAARREADGANKAKFDFLTRMSHELRTPLNALAGYAQLLDMGVHGPLNNQQREQVQRMQRNQEHLLNLINDVLNFAKLEAGHVQFNVKPFPVAEVLSSLEPLIAPQMLQNGLCYVCEAPSDDVHALADRDKVQQIVLNLLSNAVKHTRAGGRVIVSCTAHEELLAIRVNDTGEGIAADHLEAIFDPFVQLAGDSARTRDGVGLGLAISRDLARAMDGDLVAESAPGLGSTFTLWLPRAGLTPH